MRKDEPERVNALAGSYQGGKALLVLGGLSASRWEEIRDEIKPDVILGANGTCFEIDNLDFHLVVENMHMAAGKAARGEKRYQTMMKIIQSKHHARYKLVSFLNWEIPRAPSLMDGNDAIKIKRMGELGDDYESQFAKFSFREYGEGFLSGPIFMRPGALTNQRIKFRVGTVATQLLHLAGILGCSEVHTIGFDLCFRTQQRHHWYNYPVYQPDKFRTNAMFTVYKGLATQWDWVQGARWLKSIEWMFERDGLQWVDHSDGLLKVEGLRCANEAK